MRAVGQHSAGVQFNTCVKYVVYGVYMQCLVLRITSSGSSTKIVLICDECNVQPLRWLVMNVTLCTGRTMWEA